MYEIYILGQLLYQDRSVYKLRFILQNILGINRKVSFGVLYPLIEKMKTDGTLKVTENIDKRGKKELCVTERGRERFYDLMNQPVKINAHTNDTYLFKLTGLNLVDHDLATRIIRDFRAMKESKRDAYTHDIKELQIKHSKDAFCQSVIRAKQLHLDLTNTYLNYANQIESELSK